MDKKIGIWIALGVALAGYMLMITGIRTVARSAPESSETPSVQRTERTSTYQQQREEEAARRASTLCTLEDFRRIEVGMSHEEVVRIIGSPGELTSVNHINGVPGVMDSVTTEMYQWEGQGFAANAMVIFQNNRVVQKSQFGLR